MRAEPQVCEHPSFVRWLWQRMRDERLGSEEATGVRQRRPEVSSLKAVRRTLPHLIPGVLWGEGVGQVQVRAQVELHSFTGHPWASMWPSLCLCFLIPEAPVVA